MNAAKWQVSPLLFPGIGLGLSLRVKCPARVPLAGQHSSVAVARNVLHLEAVPLTERSTSRPLSSAAKLLLQCGARQGSTVKAVFTLERSCPESWRYRATGPGGRWFKSTRPDQSLLATSNL